MYVYTCIHTLPNKLRKHIWMKGMTRYNHRYGETTTQTWYHFSFSPFLGVPDIGWYEEVTSSELPNPHAMATPTCFSLLFVRNSFSNCLGSIQKTGTLSEHNLRKSHRHWWVPCFTTTFCWNQRDCTIAPSWMHGKINKLGHSSAASKLLDRVN